MGIFSVALINSMRSASCIVFSPCNSFLACGLLYVIMTNTATTRGGYKHLERIFASTRKAEEKNPIHRRCGSASTNMEVLSC